MLSNLLSFLFKEPSRVFKGNAAHMQATGRKLDLVHFAKPRWLVAAIKRGKQLDDFLIDKSARKGRRKRRSKR
jgi:hypothetical protein